MPLAVETRALETLLPDAANARVHSTRNIEAIQASLRKFGQRKPLVIDQFGVVVAGNGTLEAMRREGWLDADVTVFPGTAAEARAYALYDNRSAEFAAWGDGLPDVLRMLDDDELDPELWTQDELDEILGRTDIDAEPGDVWAAAGRPPVFGDEQIIEAAFQYFRATGFPYPDIPIYEAMQQINHLARSESAVLPNTIVGYHIPDRYQRHRFAIRAGQNRPTPVETFERDDRLRYALQYTLQATDSLSPIGLLSRLSLVRAAQMAAQFRPGYALSFYRRFAPEGATVLDTSTGFGGRLVGFFASQCGTYIGIDPSQRTHDGNVQMTADLCPKDKSVELICEPAEDVPHERVAGRCDFALTSPPYFTKEQYAPGEDTQSHVRYGTAERWRLGFLVPMMALQYAALRPGSTSVVNVAAVTIGKDTHPLDEWTIDAAQQAGFEHVDTEQLPISRVPGSGETPERFEPVLIFRRP